MSGPDPASALHVLFVGYGDWHLWKWDGFRTRSAQLARFLARSPAVSGLLVLDEPVYLRKSPRGFAVPRLRRFRSLPLRGGARPEEGKISLLDPSRFLVGPPRLKNPYTVRFIRRALRDLPRPPVLWIANVHKAFLMEALPASLRIFDAIDDWETIGAYRDLAPAIRQGYETILRRSDIVYAVSRGLADRLASRARTHRVHHLPNGVDRGLFSRPAPSPATRRRVSGSHAPVLMYVGVISERTDMTLLERVARDWPGCRLRLVGPMSRSVERAWEGLRRLGNVEWTGLVHHARIPELLRASDVLLIPHAESALSRSMDPLKLYEYLTTGLPIVSTPVPPMESFVPLVRVGSGAAFSREIGEALAEVERDDAETLWRARVEESERHTWESRVDRVLSDIGEGIPGA